MCRRLKKVWDQLCLSLSFYVKMVSIPSKHSIVLPYFSNLVSSSNVFLCTLVPYVVFQFLPDTEKTIGSLTTHLMLAYIETCPQALSISVLVQLMIIVVFVVVIFLWCGVTSARPVMIDSIVGSTWKYMELVFGDFTDLDLGILENWLRSVVWKQKVQ